MTTLTITIPDQLAEQAKAMGLLEDEVLVSLLSEAVRQQGVAEMFTAADRLAAGGMAVMTAAEVQAEIAQARAQRRAGRT